METNLTPKNVLAQQEAESKKVEIYFNSIKNATSLNQLGKEPIEFEMWCFWKHKEIEIKTRLAKDTELNPSLDELSKRIATYPPDCSWAISQRGMISKHLKDLKGAHKSWYNKHHLSALRALKEAGNNAPSVKSIDAYIEQTYQAEWKEWEEIISDYELKLESLQDHLSVWFKLDKVYTTLMYDMNAEYWRSAKKYEPDKINHPLPFQRDEPLSPSSEISEEEFNAWVKSNQSK